MKNIFVTAIAVEDNKNESEVAILIDATNGLALTGKVDPVLVSRQDNLCNSFFTVTSFSVTDFKKYIESIRKKFSYISVTVEDDKGLIECEYQYAYVYDNTKFVANEAAQIRKVDEKHKGNNPVESKRNFFKFCFYEEIKI